MTKFTYLPTVVEAHQATEDNANQLIGWININGGCAYDHVHTGHAVYLNAGDVPDDIFPGEWVVLTPQGRFEKYTDYEFHQAFKECE